LKIRENLAALQEGPFQRNAAQRKQGERYFEKRVRSLDEYAFAMDGT